MISSVGGDKRGVSLQDGLARIERPEPWPPIIGRRLVFRLHSETMDGDVEATHHVDRPTSVVVRVTAARAPSLRSICGSEVVLARMAATTASLVSARRVEPTS